MRNHNVALCYETPRAETARRLLFKRQRGVIAVFIEQYFIFHYPHDNGIAAGQTVANAITGLLAAMLDDDQAFFWRCR